MSGRIVGQVLEHAPEDLRTAEFLTLVALAEDARERDRTALRCDVESLVRRTRLKAGTVRNALAELTHRGLIKPVHTRVGRGTGRHQQYVLIELHEGHREAVIRP